MLYIRNQIRIALNISKSNAIITYQDAIIYLLITTTLKSKGNNTRKKYNKTTTRCNNKITLEVKGKAIKWCNTVLSNA